MAGGGKKSTVVTTALPANELTYPARGSRSSPVLHRDWQRIYDDVKDWRASILLFRQVAWACLGIAVASGIGWLGWDPVYKAMSAEDKVANNLQGPTLLVGTVAFLILTAVMFIADYFKGHDRDRILRGMEAVWKAATEGESGPSEGPPDV